MGIDLVGIDEVRESLRVQGVRYLNRVYTEVEQRECQRNPRRLAARFAAKEATMKTLRVGDEAVAWRSIEIAADAGGRLCIRLTGAAAALAERQGVLSLDLSLTLGRSAAMAVVLAELDGSGVQRPRSAPDAV